jgi:hypothetical protein
MSSSGIFRRVDHVRTDVSDERSDSIIGVTRISELWTTLTVTSNRRTLPKILLSPWWRRRYVPSKRQFLHGTHGVTSQKTAFFIISAVKTSSALLVPLQFLSPIKRKETRVTYDELHCFGKKIFYVLNIFEMNISLLIEHAQMICLSSSIRWTQNLSSQGNHSYNFGWAVEGFTSTGKHQKSSSLGAFQISRFSIVTANRTKNHFVITVRNGFRAAKLSVPLIHNRSTL